MAEENGNIDVTRHRNRTDLGVTFFIIKIPNFKTCIYFNSKI